VIRGRVEWFRGEWSHPGERGVVDPERLAERGHRTRAVEIDLEKLSRSKKFFRPVHFRVQSCGHFAVSEFQSCVYLSVLPSMAPCNFSELQRTA